MDIKRPFNAASAKSDSPRPPKMIINVKAQNLTAHPEDISTYTLLLRADFLTITEIWMDAPTPVNKTKFQLVHQLTMRTPLWWGCCVLAK